MRSIFVNRQLKFIYQYLLDLVFPKFCLGCADEGKWLCQECQDKILAIKTQVCPKCVRVSLFGRFCDDCRPPRSLSGIMVACYYEEGPIKEMIHNFKYNHILELKSQLTSYLVSTLKDNSEFAGSKNLIITAVPMHWLRRARRGYNQAELLADEVAKELKIPNNFKIIQKIRRTKPQVQLSGKKRLKNLKNGFRINNHSLFKNKTVIVVDDVATTGTTLIEIGRALRQAGAKEVWGLVIAKG